MTATAPTLDQLTDLTETATVHDREFPSHSYRDVWCREADITATYVVDDDGDLFIETWGIISDLGSGSAIMSQHGWEAERGDAINPPASIEQARQWLRDALATMADGFRANAAEA